MKSAAIYLVLGVGLCASGCGAPSSKISDLTDQKEASDHDHRVDWYAESESAWRDLMKRSVLAIIPARKLDESNPTEIRVTTEVLGRFDFAGPDGSQPLCDTERFLDQPVAATCTGTLISPDLVVTAGHCVPDIRTCQGQRFVFNFYQQSPDELARITANDVYGCDEVLVTVDGTVDDQRVDYAVIRLDRPVAADKRPARVRKQDGELRQGTELALVGTPLGVPLKMAADAEVKSPGTGLDFFSHTLDAMNGASGAGVFDARGNVVGVHSRAWPSFKSRGACYVSDVSDEGNIGSATYIARVLDGLCAVEPDESICTDFPEEDPVKDPGESDAGPGEPDAGPGDDTDAGPIDPGPGDEPSDAIHAVCRADLLPLIEFDTTLVPQTTPADGVSVVVDYRATFPVDFSGSGSFIFSFENDTPISAVGTVTAPIGSWEVTCSIGEAIGPGGDDEPNNDPPITDPNLDLPEDGAITRIVDVPDNATALRIAISGGEGDADLYVRYGEEPTLIEFDCRPFKSGNDEECFFANPQAGEWHVLVFAAEAFTGVDLTIDITTLDAEDPVADPDSFSMACTIDGLEGLVIDVVVTPGSDVEDGQAVAIVAYGPFGLSIGGELDFDFLNGVPALASGVVTTLLGELGIHCSIYDWPSSWESPFPNTDDILIVNLDASGDAGSETLWDVEIPEGTKELIVTASEGTGDADLYVKYGAPPTVDGGSHDADCASFGRSSERCVIRNPQPGPWYVLLVGFTEFSGVDVEAIAIPE